MNTELCPKMESALNLLSKKWVGLIVYSLLSGPSKFNEIEKYIPGLSARMLTERLKELETEGIIKKTVLQLNSVRIQYSLTRKGEDLLETFKKIGEWAEKWN